MESLAVKYRPTEFEDVSSQESIIKILNRQLKLKQYNNTYLFCGPSGCGKTTIARIFANKINNNVGSYIEIDGASNNGVDNVKNLIHSARERSIDSEYKIYIIDECHMLTTQAWNAFLKCIEETPKYTIFIFCTTDPQKIPATIQNRCMRFNLTRIPYTNILKRLVTILTKEGYVEYGQEYSEEICKSYQLNAVDYIAKTSNGGMRDAIATLEKCLAYSTNLTVENCLHVINMISYDVMFTLIDSIISGNEKEVINIINNIYQEGNDLNLFVEQFLNFCMDLAKYCIMQEMSITKIPVTFKDKVEFETGFEGNIKYYDYVLDNLLDLKSKLKGDVSPKTTIEICLLKITRCH